MLLVVVKVFFILFVVILLFAPLITWVERKQSAIMQDRIGANRADIAGMTFLGLLHPAADVIKLLTKEDVVPAGANRTLHALAPIITAIPAVIAFAVIPYGGVYVFGDSTVSLVAADIDWGCSTFWRSEASPPTAACSLAGRVRATGRSSAASATRPR